MEINKWHANDKCFIFISISSSFSDCYNLFATFVFPLLIALYLCVCICVVWSKSAPAITMDRYKNKAIHCWTWQIFIISFCSWAIFLFPFSSLIPFRRMELKFFSSVDFMNWDRISIHEIHENHETFREQTVFGDKLRICFNSVIPYYFR